jgi:hypothetical protein
MKVNVSKRCMNEDFSMTKKKKSKASKWYDMDYPYKNRYPNKRSTLSKKS